MVLHTFAFFFLAQNTGLEVLQLFASPSPVLFNKNKMDNVLLKQTKAMAFVVQGYTKCSSCH